MRAVQLDAGRSRRRGPGRAAANCCLISARSAGLSSRGTWPDPRPVGQREGRPRPSAVRQRLVDALPRQPASIPCARRGASWMPTFAPLLPVDEIHHALRQRSGLLIGPHAGAAGGDAPVGRRRRSSRSSPGPPRPAPLPRCTRWKSLGRPSAARYWHIGETTTRLRRVRPRRRNGGNIGGARRPVPCPGARSCPANQRSTVSTSSGSRSCRLSEVTRLLRVMQVERELAAGAGRCSGPRFSNHSRLVCAARCGGGRSGPPARPRRPPAPSSVSGCRAGSRGQRDRVLHGQLGARADGEVRGVRGVAEQHQVAVPPALVADGGERAATSSC